MMIFGINFNIYYLIITKKVINAIKSEELWIYIIMILTASGLIAYNTHSIYNNVGDAIRHAFFQVNAIVSTTGYATTDFNLWPTLSKGIIIILMFIGGCAGSTAGGFKLSRVILLFKNATATVKQMIHSRSVTAVRFEGKSVDNATILGVTNYLAIYTLCFFVILVIILFEPFSFEMNFATVTACFNNVGPSFEAAGPMGNYDCYSYFAKIVLSFAMLLGRLEIFPMLILFSPTVWKKRRAKS
jgi:trk system potassium uptake protein TrkH